MPTSQFIAFPWWASGVGERVADPLHFVHGFTLGGVDPLPRTDLDGGPWMSDGALQ
jgi:hypothetical protein